MSRAGIVLIIALTAKSAVAEVFTESEPTVPNDSKAAANAFTLSPGDAIQGNSTSGVGAGPDYFRIKTVPMSWGVYRHRLVIISDTPGHTGHIRGLVQSAGVITPGSDIFLQTTSPGTTPPRFLQWYGFGKEEEIYVRIQGTPGTTADYVATLSTDPVSFVDTTVFYPGQIMITTAGMGHSTDTDLWVYDFYLDAIVDFGNDNGVGLPNGWSSLTRTITSGGEFFLALTSFNFANNLASPSDDDRRTGTVLDFPNAVVNGLGPTTPLNMQFSITDSTGIPYVVPNTKSEPYDVNWFRFLVYPGGACCLPGGTCTITSMTECTGTFLGDGTSCTPNPCAPTGACCAADGACSVTTQAECTGVWHGEWTSCTPNNCPQPEVACCFADGSCEMQTASDCTSAGGTPGSIGSTCTPNPCPQPPDCNANGTPDAEDILGGTSQDCNANDTPDECDLAVGGDTNSNGVLDVCEDCNTNGVIDVDELVTGADTKLVASDPSAQHRFGWRVSISGDHALVAARQDDAGGTNAGAAYLFERDMGGGWVQFKKLVPADLAAGDAFGESVALDGARAVVGTIFHDAAGTSAGAVYVFDRDEGGPGNWGQSAKLTASDATTNTWLGVSVALEGDRFIAGANGSAPTGAAYVFRREPSGEWAEEARLSPSDVSVNIDFGRSVGISGDTVIVGAANADDACPSNLNCDSGAAYIFERDAGGSWVESAKVLGSGAAANDSFGFSVSISGDVAVVGSSGEDIVGDDSGAAYVYARNQGGSSNWGEVAKLTAADAASVDVFGNAVSISGETILVGAWLDDDGGASSGSAYVFTSRAGNWQQVAKLHAFDAAAGDAFGYSVSVSGDEVLLGALHDDGAATDAGAAYVFALRDADCNDDRIPDECDIAAGTSLDFDADGLPDECDDDDDNDGVADASDVCAQTPPGTPVNPNGCPIVSGDGDGDGDIDGADHEAFTGCMTEPGTPPTAGCEDFDVDADGDIDLDDWAAFQSCFSGNGIPADPGCTG